MRVCEIVRSSFLSALTLSLFWCSLGSLSTAYIALALSLSLYFLHNFIPLFQAEICCVSLSINRLMKDKNHSVETGAAGENDNNLIFAMKLFNSE